MKRGNKALGGTVLGEGFPFHPDDDGKAPDIFRGTDALTMARELGFSGLVEKVVNDLVPDANSRTPEALLAESVAWDIWRLRENVAAQFLGEVSEEQAEGGAGGQGEITLEGEIEGFEPPEITDAPKDDDSIDESLAERFARLGPNLGRSILPPASLRAEESRLLKQMIEKVRLIRANERHRILNSREKRWSKRERNRLGEEDWEAYGGDD